MPIHRYCCPVCKSELKAFSTKGVPDCLVCSVPMERQIGTPDCLAMETADAYRGVVRFQDTNAKSKKRVQEHFQKVELPKIIEKEGIGYAIKQGWVKPENTPK